MTEEIIQIVDTDVKHGELVESSATYCMVCQNIVYVAYVLDHGVYHCPSCISEKEVNAITRSKNRREGRDTPDARDLKKAMADFKSLGFSDEGSKIRKVMQHKAIGCEHGKWNKDKTNWKWNEKWICDLCKWSCSTEGEVTKNKKQHEEVHKAKWDKLLASKKEGQTAPKVQWLLGENRRDD